MILNKEDLKTEELNSKLQNSNTYELSSYFFIETIRQFFSLFNNGYYYFYYIFFRRIAHCHKSVKVYYNFGMCKMTLKPPY